jgi:ABC-type uncharacterized transport system involved in gliding motility auxiliary subunit/ABC-type transport system involved in cytochrome c biogenesis permease component
MSPVLTVARREFSAYFATPLASVFLVAFLVLAAVFAFYLGNFYENGQADLQTFFRFHPWLYLLFAPALAMRLWAEERKSGTLELLMTLPLPVWQVVLGKFLAAWAFLALGLALTCPIWITVNWLGDPDNGVILAGYLASLLMAGLYLAACGMVSATTRSQVIAYVGSILLGLLLLLAGFPLVQDIFRSIDQTLADAVAQLSVLTHFTAITRGVLDLRDMLFFVAGILAFLAITVFLVDVRRLKAASMSRAPAWAMTAGACVLIVAGYVAVVALGYWGLRGARLDLTENRLYTLSDGTLNILAQIDEPIRLELYYSETVAQSYPQFRLYAQRVRELLEEVKLRANGKVELEIIDPVPFSPEEDRATEHGLQGVPIGNSGESLYFGLVAINSTDQTSYMPFVQPDKEAFLEYDLAKLISSITIEDVPVVALLSGLPTGPGVDPVTGAPSQGWVVDRQMSELFELRRLPAETASIGEDVDLLMVVHPKSLSDDALFAIDQFVLRGGHLLAFVDPDAESDPSANLLDPVAMAEGRDSDLAPLFRAWGIRYDPSQVVIDTKLAKLVQPDPSRPPVRMPAILGLDGDSLNSDDVATSDLGKPVNVSSAGALELADDSPLRLEPLLLSSTQSMLTDSQRVRELALDPERLFEGFRPAGQTFVLGARFTGSLPTAFPQRAAAGGLAQSARPANIVVIADTDLLSDRLWVSVGDFMGQPMFDAFAANGDLVYNLAENLVGSADLIAVRTRAGSQRPFLKVEELKRAAEQRLRTRELELQSRLQEVEQRLQNIQLSPDGQPLALGPQQQADLREFQEQKLQIRRELRDVQHQLNADYLALGSRLKQINILAAPLLVVLVGVGLAFHRARRRRAALAA